MRVTVDLLKCQGYANCTLEAPEIFDLDDDTNKAIVLVEEIEPGMEPQAQQAEASCPVRAITLHE